MFYMPLRSTGVGTPSRTVYKELRAFGPGENPRFSPSLILGVQQAANRTWRSVRAFCRGWVQVVGVEAGHPPDQPDTPLVVSLMPHWAEMIELTRICQLHQMETPCLLLYGGIDPASLRLRLLPILKKAAEYVSAPAISEETLWQSFLGGEMSAFVGGGMEVGVVHEGSQPGTYPLSITAVTARLDRKKAGGPKQVLDPVALFHRLASEKLLDGTPAMVKTETTNSWLDVVRQDRVLITFRDEWNDALVWSDAVVRGDGGVMKQGLIQGTLSLPVEWKTYHCQVPGHQLTRVPTDEEAADEVSYQTTAPAHHVVAALMPSQWFPKETYLTNPQKELSRWTEGNHVEVLVDGFTAFPRIVEDMRRITSAEHFVFIAGWLTDMSFPLVPGIDQTRMGYLLSLAITLGATVRALIWELPIISDIFPDIFVCNSRSVNFINILSPNSAILDSRTHHNIGIIHRGAHHAKYIVIRNSEGLYVHLGGMDLNENRLDGPDHLPGDTRYHDVNCRVEGPCAAEVAKSFIDRWNDHPDGQKHPLLLSIPTAPKTGSCLVQVNRTYGAGTLSYAPNGERAIRDAIRTAVLAAKKYIYIEDQYLVYPGLRDDLELALNYIEHLVIVMDGTCDMGIPGIANTSAEECQGARYLFLAPLVTKARQKIHVFTLGDVHGPYKVHTKAIIIDDIWATLGSANQNSRGMTHDTELNICVVDGKVTQGARPFARDMRIKLWAEHLGWHHRSPGDLDMRLGDIEEGIRYLTTARPSSSRLTPYDTLLGHRDTPVPDWDLITDPDGSPPIRP